MLIFGLLVGNRQDQNKPTASVASKTSMQPRSKTAPISNFTMPCRGRLEKTSPEDNWGLPYRVNGPHPSWIKQPVRSCFRQILARGLFYRVNLATPGMLTHQCACCRNLYGPCNCSKTTAYFLHITDD